MKSWIHPGAVFLGRGGSRPGVVVVHPDLRVEPLIEFPEGHSVYALDLSPEGTTLAVGARNGTIVIAAGPNGGGRDGSSLELNNLLQGSPILSLCWMDEDHFAASDLAGRVLLWDRDDPRNPRLLKTDHGLICSLVKLPEARLAGLCADGRLLIWNRSAGEPREVHQLAPPPDPCSLVPLVYLSRRQSLFYPGRGGGLVEFSLEGTKQVRPAHEGDFHAIFAQGGFIFSVGRHDGRLRVWPPDIQAGGMEYAAPPGVISGSPLTGEPLRMVLVMENGRAGIHRLGNQGLEEVAVIAGEDFRQAFTSHDQSGTGEPSRELVQGLATKIETALDLGDDSEAESLHKKLLEWGYEHVSLALKTDRALKEGRNLEALRMSQSLIDLLPSGDPRTASALVRHASLLERFWLLEEARAVHHRISEMDPMPTWASEIGFPFEGLDGIRPIIEPDIEPEEIIQASDILASGFRGDYVVKKQRPQRCQGVRFTARELADKYNQTDRPDRLGLGAVGRSEETSWISRQGLESVGMVFFDDETADTGLQFSVRLTGGDDQTVITPVILFRWIASGDYTTSNQQARRALRESLRSSSIYQRLDSVYQAAMDAVRRLVTEASSQRGGYP